MTETIYRIQMQSGADVGRVYDLAGTSLTVGRYPLADIVLDDTDVSYRHALLTRGGTSYRLADLGSDAGTYINGIRIGAEPVELSPGDMIQFGGRVSAAFMAVVDEPVVFEIEEQAEPSPALAVVEEERLDLLHDESPDSTALHPENEYDAPPWPEDEAPETAELPGERPAALPIAAAETGSSHAGPLPAMPPPQKNKAGRIALIAAGCLILLLACCCSASLFMYFVGGDWLLNQLGYMP